MTSPSSYAQLLEQLDRLIGLAETGQWADAAALMQGIQPQKIQSAGATDRATIEACLKKLNALAEIAEPLHGHMGKLLKGLAAGS